MWEYGMASVHCLYMLYTRNSCDITSIRSLFVINTLHPAGGLSNDISSPTPSHIFICFSTACTPENHAFVGHFDTRFYHARQYRSWIHSCSWQTQASTAALNVFVNDRGFPTRPSTTKHCCAMWKVASSYKCLSIQPHPLTRWIHSSFVPMPKPSTGSRCNVTSTCPTSNPKYTSLYMH